MREFGEWEVGLADVLYGIMMVKEDLWGRVPDRSGGGRFGSMGLEKNLKKPLTRLIVIIIMKV